MTYPMTPEEMGMSDRCPFCTHAWRRHDPEDGMCDAPKEGGWSVCPCGRDGDWMRAQSAALSRAALNASADARIAARQGKAEQ